MAVWAKVSCDGLEDPIAWIFKVSCDGLEDPSDWILQGDVLTECNVPIFKFLLDRGS